MKRQVYLDLQEKHRQEISDFPIAYAFSKEQLEEALVKLGVKDVSECVTVMNHGDIVKREDAPKLLAMFKRHTKETHDLLLSDPEVAEAAFLYEMDNHEYAINWSADEDTLAAFGMDVDDLNKMGLKTAYMNARRKHFKHAEEWGMI